MRTLSTTILCGALLAPIGANGQESGRVPAAGAVHESPAKLIREDREGESHCSMVVDGKTIWEATTPILTMSDVNDEGCLVGLGSVSIRYGTQGQRADAFVIVNAEGKLVLLDAFRPVTDLWPHGNTYPVFLGVHATPRVAVFRFVPGPGLREQWWTFDINSGGRLRSVDLSDVVDQALDPDHDQNLAELGTHALPRASMFAVVVAPIREVIPHGDDESAKAGFSGTSLVLVALGKGAVWSRQGSAGSYFVGPPEVRALDPDNYEVQVERVVGSSTVRNALRVEKKSGLWETRVLQWD